MMKILVTGANGQLGFDVIKELLRRGQEVLASDIAYDADKDLDGACYISLDIGDEVAVTRVIRENKPDAVIHCAAWTAVDAAEKEENRERVYRVNSFGTRNIAMSCLESDCKMIYISTDYVFDGSGDKPWEPECMDFAPLSVYGSSKLDGELAVSGLVRKFFIVRTAWVFGSNGNNFIRTMLKAGKDHDTLRVVNDQIGTPTYTKDLAILLCDMVKSDKYGYYHATNEGGFISWYDFAKSIFALAKEKGLGEYEGLKLIPVTSEEYGLSLAVRPKNSRLDKSKLSANGFTPLPDWRDALGRYLDSIKTKK